MKFLQKICILIYSTKFNAFQNFIDYTLINFNFLIYATFLNTNNNNINKSNNNNVNEINIFKQNLKEIIFLLI